MRLALLLVGAAMLATPGSAQESVIGHAGARRRD